MSTNGAWWSVEGKVGVVIGAAGHLCSVLAKGMQQAGMRIIAIDVAESARTGNDTGDGIEVLRADVTSKADLIQCRDQIMRQHGRVDVLLNGAGTNAPTPFFDITKPEIDRILGVNLIGTLHACQVFGEVMVKQRAGSIINFASVSMGPPLSKAFIYSIAKAGVANLTQNLAREWAPYHVRVNALRPGFFPTTWSMEHFIDQERQAKIFGHTPMGRFGKPEELTGAVLWLCSDAATFVTGSIVTVDGGFTAMTI